jgi:hypothetical protein
LAEVLSFFSVFSFEKLFPSNPLNLTTMYYIRKYSNGVAIHNDETGRSRLLTEAEVKAVKKEFPQLEQSRVKTVFADEVKSIREKP